MDDRKLFHGMIDPYSQHNSLMIYHLIIALKTRLFPCDPSHTKSKSMTPTQNHPQYQIYTPTKPLLHPFLEDNY